MYNRLIISVENVHNNIFGDENKKKNCTTTKPELAIFYTTHIRGEGSKGGGKTIMGNYTQGYTLYLSTFSFYCPALARNFCSKYERAAQSLWLNPEGGGGGG